jgi:ribosomal protein L32
MSTTRLYAILVVILFLSLVNGQALADQEVGRVRVASFVCPRQVAPGKVFSASLDIEYEVRTSVTIRGAISEKIRDAEALVWLSGTAVVSGGGDKVWTVNITAPLQEGALELTAYAYYLQGSVWTINNVTVLGPGSSEALIKVARDANLRVQLGVPGVELKLGNSSEKTSQQGEADASIPIGIPISLAVPDTVDYQNFTRLVFNGWRDGSNQSSRIISIDEDTQVVGTYRTQYLLRVTSNLPSRSYQQWYGSGSNVTIQEPNSVPFAWPLDVFGTNYVFSGWSGDVSSESTELNFTMNAPTTIHANFSVAYGPQLAFFVVISLGIAAESIVLSLKRKRRTGDKTQSQPLMRTCPNCGYEIEEEWAHCIHCGVKLPPQIGQGMAEV